MTIVPLVLAGGASSRFWPLSSKNRFPFLGLSVLQHKLNELAQTGFSQTIVVVPKEEAIYFEELIKDVSTIKIQLLIQESSKGMGDAVLIAKDYFMKHHPKAALYVLNGNDFINPSWHKQVLGFVEKSFGGVVPGYQVSHYFPGGYLVADAKSQLIKIVEKPGEGQEPSNLVKMVADLFTNPQSFFELIEKAYQKKHEMDDHYEQALTEYARKQPVLVKPYLDYWGTLKYPWHVLWVVDLLLSKFSALTIHPTAKVAKSAVIQGHVTLAENVKVYDHAVINGPAYIGPNTVIGTNALVVKSMIEHDCVVGFQSEVTRSYLGPHVWLHQNYVGDSVLDAGVSFGAKAVTANYRFDQGSIKSQVKGEWIDSHLKKLGTMVGQNSRVGVAAQTMPGVKIGANAILGPGASLSKDCPNDTAVFVKQTHLIKKNKVKLVSVEGV